MNKPRVIVTRRWPETVEARLQDLFEVTLNRDDRPMTTSELSQAMREHDAVLTTVTDAITAEVLQAEPRRARILGNFGVGFNHIDVAAARSRGVMVTNTPEVLTDCTADIAMALLLMVARRAGEGERQVRNRQWGGWRPTQLLGTKVTGKTLGLVGFGRIARAMAKRAHFGFEMPIVFFDPVPPSKGVAETLGARRCETLEQVLREADFVSLHCPGSPQNRHLIGAEQFKLMKRGGFLINTARGDVVDTEALVQALECKRIAGAGLDVYEHEPNLHLGLSELENVVLLPHLGSATEETRIAMGMRVIDNVTAFFAGETPRDKVA